MISRSLCHVAFRLSQPSVALAERRSSLESSEVREVRLAQQNRLQIVTVYTVYPCNHLSSTSDPSISSQESQYPTCTPTPRCSHHFRSSSLYVSCTSSPS